MSYCSSTELWEGLNLPKNPFRQKSYGKSEPKFHHIGMCPVLITLNLISRQHKTKLLQISLFTTQPSKSYMFSPSTNWLLMSTSGSLLQNHIHTTPFGLCFGWNQGQPFYLSREVECQMSTTSKISALLYCVSTKFRSQSNLLWFLSRPLYGKDLTWHVR